MAAFPKMCPAIGLMAAFGMFFVDIDVSDVASVSVAFVEPAHAQGASRSRSNSDDEPERPRTRRAQVLSRPIGEALTRVQENLDEDNPQAALEQLNNMVNRSNLSEYEQSSILQYRGGVRAQFFEDYDGAIQDFQAAIAAGGFEPDQTRQLKFNLGQLHAIQENWTESIRYLEEYLAESETRDGTVLYLLATGYVQLGRFQDALPYAVEAKDTSQEPQSARYELLNYIYNELRRVDDRLALLRDMVRLWPEKKNNWTQLSGLLNERGDEFDAFAVYELAYHMGVLESSSELATLANFYAFFDNPYRGARLLEREIAAGNVERTGDNVELLANYWSIAREHERALPVLREAAQSKNSPTLFYQLGQAHYSQENWSDAEDALRQAIRRNGQVEREDRLSREEIGQIWFLIANTLYNRGDRRDAQEAFGNAVRYDNVSRSATGWINFIDAEIDAERRQAQVEAQLRQQEEARERARAEEAERARRLIGGDTPDDGADQPPDGN